jgi:acyl transferase domain-containing protein
MPVAIVGIGCRFPGGVKDVAGFWQLLGAGQDAITEIPASRFDLEHYFDPRAATPGRVMTRWGGFLDRIEDFDAEFFEISPREAQSLDPQQRLLLETAWEALEDAGQDARALEGSRTAVFVGQWISDFESRLFANPEGVDFPMTTGSGRYAASGRLSYVLGLRGPSLTVDCACSSSLAAVHLAVQSIRSGESELALAGGVNVILQPHISIAYSQSRMMAPDGRCKFGDASGDGYVRSEGAAIVALKPLERAIADGDRIHAVIRGSAVNNDGRSSGSMGTPSRSGQEDLLRTAYRDAAVSPSRVGYIEAHGTGTRAGDPVELGALGSVLGEGRPAGSACLVGSVKTNFGHTEGAAGVAGLIKAALAVRHGVIPRSLHFKQANPNIAWADIGLAVPTATSAWPAGEASRVAGVSAFGIAGTNAHVVLEQAPVADEAHEPVGQRPAYVLPLSARSPQALRELSARYATLLDTAGASLGDVCFSAATRRTALEHRAAFVAADAAAMVDALRRHAAGEAVAAEGVAQRDAAPKIVFVFPGQGAQWQGMARQLMAQEPVFRDTLERCDAAAKPWLDVSIVEQLLAPPGAPNPQLERIDVIQPVLVALAIAYAALWRSLGVEPDAVVGHSMGEVGAAHVAGVLSLEQAMRIICRRSALMRRTSGQGAMALVDLSMADAAQRLAGLEGRVGVAVGNSPRSSVISGEPAAVQQVLDQLTLDGVFCRRVNVDVASHSPQMAPLARELASELADLVPAAQRLPIYSTVLARRAEAAEFGPGYWAANLRQPVLFGQTVGQIIADGMSVFIELGPHPVLLPAVQQTALSAGAEMLGLECARRDEPEHAAIALALGKLWCAGYPLAWQRWMPQGGRFVDLPLYPWQRERHWSPAADAMPGASRGQLRISRPDDESLTWLHRLQWQECDPPAPGSPIRHWLVATDDEPAGHAIASALAAAGCSTRVVTLDALSDGVARSGPGPCGVLVLAPESSDAAYLPVSAVQALAGAPSPAAARLWFVTRGGQAVPAATGRVSVDHAALWGCARVVAEEHPQWWGGLVDLDPAAEVAELAPLLARHLLCGDAEDQVALRGGHRSVLRLVKAEIGATPARPRWRADAAYLITGGLGDIGLHIARAMVDQGARRLVLVGRTPLPPRDQWLAARPDSLQGQRIGAVRALEAQGAAVHVAAVDVGDEAALREFLSRYQAEGWPTIRGVVHAAGAFDNQLVGAMNRAAFDAVVGPKLRGAQFLDRLLPELDLFVMFSSVGAYLVQPGQANYAAANAGLDAVAQDRRARGLPALSIGWGVWRDTGLVKGDAGVRNVAEMERQGIQAFSAERGTAMFSWLCPSDETCISVLPIDWAVFGRSRAGRGLALFKEMLASAAPAGAASGGAAPAWADAPPAERRKLLEVIVREAVGRVLNLPPARLDPRKAMGSMGLNSLMAMELRNRLEAALGRSLSATLAWNHPTIDALVAFLAGPDEPAASAEKTAPPPAEASPLSERLTAVVGLSDEEAALALRGGRSRGRP